MLPLHCIDRIVCRTVKDLPCQANDPAITPSTRHSLVDKHRRDSTPCATMRHRPLPRLMHSVKFVNLGLALVGKKERRLICLGIIVPCAQMIIDR